jgi:hypothetical protein
MLVNFDRVQTAQRWVRREAKQEQLPIRDWNGQAQFLIILKTVILG